MLMDYIGLFCVHIFNLLIKLIAQKMCVLNACVRL